MNIDLKTEFENREYLEDDISKTELIKRYLDSIVQLQVKERTQILY